MARTTRKKKASRILTCISEPEKLNTAVKLWDMIEWIVGLTLQNVSVMIQKRWIYSEDSNNHIGL